jgi:hypothetical protein
MTVLISNNIVDISVSNIKDIKEREFSLLKTVGVTVILVPTVIVAVYVISAGGI